MLLYIHRDHTDLLGARRPQYVSISTSTQLLSPVMYPLLTMKTITVLKLTLKLCYLLKCHNPSLKILTATQFYPQSLTTSKPNNDHVQPKPNFKAHSTTTAVENHAPHEEAKRGETKGRQPKQPKAQVRWESYTYLITWAAAYSGATEGDGIAGGKGSGWGLPPPTVHVRKTGSGGVLQEERKWGVVQWEEHMAGTERIERDVQVGWAQGRAGQEDGTAGRALLPSFPFAPKIYRSERLAVEEFCEMKGEMCRMYQCQRWSEVVGWKGGRGGCSKRNMVCLYT